MQLVESAAARKCGAPASCILRATPVAFWARLRSVVHDVQLAHSNRQVVLHPLRQLSPLICGQACGEGAGMASVWHCGRQRRRRRRRRRPSPNCKTQRLRTHSWRQGRWPRRAMAPQVPLPARATTGPASAAGAAAPAASRPHDVQHRMPPGPPTAAGVCGTRRPCRRCPPLLLAIPEEGCTLKWVRRAPQRQAHGLWSHLPHDAAAGRPADTPARHGPNGNYMDKWILQSNML